MTAYEKMTPQRKWRLKNKLYLRQYYREYRKRRRIPRSKEEHHCAHHVCLRSPRNIVYEVRNIKEFIRANPSLFNKEDIIWVVSKNNRCVRCKASNGLTSICPYSSTHKVKKTVNGSWKGWTYVSELEKFEHAKNL